MLHAILLIIGLALLIGGADVMVRGVSSLARAAGVPPLVVGLTLVAFGTSMPEVVINTLSAVNGETGLAFGNLVGSCTLNIGFVLGIAAIVRPLNVEPSIITREIPMMILAAAAMLVLSEDITLNHASENALVRADGLILLLLFCVFLYNVIMGTVARTKLLEVRHDPFIDELKQNVADKEGIGAIMRREKFSWISVVMTIGGIAGVTAGGHLTLDAAIAIAKHLQIPEAVIGLTLVSFGTTLPELATSVMATRRGQSDVAIGNIVGSNIFNILFIGGTVSVIRPIAMPPGGQSDLLMMTGMCVVLLPVAIRGPRKVTRAEGFFLLISCLAYTTWRVISSR